MRIHEQFVYGFSFAIIITSIVLATQYGDHFNFLKNEGLTILPSYGEALNWKSAIAFTIVFLLFFKNLTGTISHRLTKAFMLFAFSWALFDFLWIVKAVYMGNFLFGSQTLIFPSQREIIIGVARNCLIMLFSFPFILSHLKISLNVIVSFGVFVAYWVFLFIPTFLRMPTSRWPSISITSILFYAPVFYFVNFLPFLTAFKDGVGRSWKMFLFV